MLNERRPAVTSSSSWTNEQEDALYKSALAEALIDRTKMMNVKEYPEGRTTGELPKGRKAKKEEKEKRKKEEAMFVEKERAVGPWCAGNIRIGEMVLLIDSVSRGRGGEEKRQARGADPVSSSSPPVARRTLESPKTASLTPRARWRSVLMLRSSSTTRTSVSPSVPSYRASKSN